MTKIIDSLSRFKRSVGLGNMDDQQPIVDDSESSRPSGLMSSEESHTTYTELLNGSVPCPSCNGRGNIPRHMETQLVALIPVSDSRLKPRRTCLYVGLSMSAVIAVAALAIFFLLPREVSINSDRLGFIHDINMIEFNTTARKMTIEFPFEVALRNDNYFWVHMNSFNATIYQADGMETRPIGSSSNMTAVSIPPRSSGYPLSVRVNITSNDYGLMLYCNSSIDPHHIMSFVIDTLSQVSVGYFMASEIENLRVIKQLCCMPNGNCTDTSGL